MSEVWKPVVGHEAIYEVSSEGRVRSRDHVVSYIKKGRVLSPGFSSNGYPSVIFSGRDSRTIHSVVAETFIGPCPIGHQVRHKDGQRANCALDNLEYGTPKENGQDRVRHGTTRRGKRK